MGSVSRQNLIGLYPMLCLLGGVYKEASADGVLSMRTDLVADGILLLEVLTFFKGIAVPNVNGLIGKSFGIERSVM
jgi:hypothetical protein